MGGRNLAYKDSSGEGTRALVDNDVTNSTQVGFSDIVSSPKGQVFTGTLGSRPDRWGHVAQRMFIPNRLGRSLPCGDRGTAGATHQWPWLFAGGIASLLRGLGYITVFRYRVDADGSLTDKHTFATLE